MVAAGKMGDETNKIPLASETWTKEVKEELLKLLAVEKERVKVMEEERRERQENRKTSIDPTLWYSAMTGWKRSAKTS